MNVAILGTGYVGLTTGACLAYLGHQVTCVDPVAEKIGALQRGEVPFHEPYLEELLVQARPNLKFTMDYSEAIPDAQVVFIAVGTPPGVGGAPDLRYLQAAAEGVGERLGPHFTVIVNKSTVPIGSGNWVGALVRDAAERRGHGKDCFAVASNPEFLREGSALARQPVPGSRGDRRRRSSDRGSAVHAVSPDSGSDVSAADVSAPAGRVGGVPLISTDLASAELIKYAANAFLALKISYINEIGQLAEKVGADITQVARGIGLDARIGTRFLQAGIGWGGSCFGKDTAALISTAARIRAGHGHREGCPTSQPAPAGTRGGEAARRTENSQGPHRRPAGSGVQASHRRSAGSSRAGRRAPSAGTRCAREGPRSGRHGPIQEGTCRRWT